MSEQNKAAVRRVFEAWSTGDVDLLDDAVAADAVDHDPYNPNGDQGLEGLKKTISAYREAFPDLRIEVEDEIAEGDRVAVRWTATGTHQGDMMGVPASGRTSTISGIGIDRVEDGKIVESWSNWDVLGMLQQIGAIPQEQPAQA